MIRFHAALLCVLCTAAGAEPADPAVRPNGLIFNETVPLADGVVSELPLYLTRRGEYYAQAILEPGASGARPDVDLALDIRIARRDDIVFERRVNAVLGAGQPVSTLFWVTSDRELPIKTPLMVSLRVDGAGPASGEQALRIQIKRKPNPGFRAVW